MTMAELAEEILEQITALCERGDELAEEDAFDEAVEAYDMAWSLLPEPKTQWEAATWILAAIGDVAFIAGDLDTAKEALQTVMSCPDAIGNPFIHLRLGQVLFDLDEKDAAADELMRAYMGAGAEIFEEEEPAYLEFLKTRAKLD